MKIEEGYTPEQEQMAAIDKAAISGFFGGVLWMLVLGALIFGLKH